MVCESCQEKLKALACPDKWKDGGSSGGGKVKAGKTNKALAASKASSQWIPKECHCRICKTKTLGSLNFCNNCAHKKGICASCGKKTVDTSAHKMSLK